MAVAEPGPTIEQKLILRSPHAVLFMNDDWSIEYANRRALEIAKAEASGLTGQTLWAAFPEFSADGRKEACLRAIRNRTQTEFDLRMGSGMWLEVCVDPHESGIALYCRDITDGKLAQLALEERENELHDFFQNGNVALHWVGADGEILWVNQAELSMLGYTAEEYIGRSIRDFHLDPSIIDDILNKLKNNECLEQYESRMRCKDGSIRHVAISSSVYRRDGQFVHTRCFTRDITAERARAEIQELLGAIVESSDDAIISKDLDGVVTSWNKTAERLFGYTADEAIGQTIAALLIPADRQDEEPEILSKLRRGERVDHFQTQRRRKDGRLLDISLTISPVKDARGNIVGASKIARDITAFVRGQEALQEANDALRRSNADLEQFAYSASHDLQEPLRMVSIYAEMLAKKCGDTLDESAKEYLRYVMQGGERMERLLTDLRAYTHISTRLEGQPPVTDSSVVLKKVIGILRPALEQSGAEVEVNELPRIAVHEFELEQLLQNIIGNALRYKSESRPRIKIWAEGDGSHWRFSVQDNGIGIAREYQEHIFGLFRRLGPRSEYPGSGMGLAICRRIVDRAGGRIWVESEPGRGSTFHFLLPGEAK